MSWRACPAGTALVVACTVGCGRVGFEPIGAGGVDASPHGDAVASLCDAFSDALWCNDFEAADLRGATAMGGGTAGFAPGGGFGGSDGYEVTSDPGDQPRLRIQLPAAVTAGRLHIAGRMFFEAGPATESFVVVAQALSPSFAKISFDMNSEDRAQIVNTIAGSGAQARPGSFPRGSWGCFELAIAVAADGEVELLIDDDLALIEAGPTTAPQEGFTVVEIGALSSDANIEPVRVRFDNLIVRASPIGCP